MRLSCGLAAAMAITDPHPVTSGFFRNHLYVLLGLTVFSTLLAAGGALPGLFWLAGVAAVLSYAGAVCWLYEAATPGRWILLLIAILCGWGAIVTARAPAATSSLAEKVLWWLDPLTSSWLLGGVFTAMLLGHWYLNVPGMALAPLQRLTLWGAGGLAARLLQWMVSFGLLLSANGGNLPEGWEFWVLHAGPGLLAVGPVLWMSWETLKIPNTQSATGILYVGVILTFLGEVASLLICKSAVLPL
ncbi:MAG: hypothetical protein SFX18_16085 [Pirellulales bacterium]|nr:hypothetical protein [Pirellulales bacterium]